MSDFDAGGKGGPKGKGSSMWDGLKTIGRGILEGLSGGGTASGKGGAPGSAVRRSASRRDPVATYERPMAVKQIHRSLKAWRDARGDIEQAQRKPQIPSGGGNPLPKGVQSQMEAKLGADLSGVKVHTGGDSAKASEGLSARAFTVGDDVHFNEGEFDPGSKEGTKLLAHELTHVVQGQKGGVQKKEADDGEPAAAGAGGDLEVSDPDEPAEQEADAVSEEATKDVGDKGVEGEAAESPQEKAPEAGAKTKSSGSVKASDVRRMLHRKEDEGDGTAATDGAEGEQAEQSEGSPSAEAQSAEGEGSEAEGEEKVGVAAKLNRKLHRSAKIFRGTASEPHADRTNVIIESGNYMLKPALRNKAFTRDRCYGKSYNSDVMDWKNRMLTTSVRSGGLRHPTDPNKYKYGDTYYVNSGTTIASIGHEKPPVVNHWNETGRKSTQDVRRTYFNGDGSPANNLIIQPLSVNSSDGASSGDNYNYQVTKDFRGPQ